MKELKDLKLYLGNNDLGTIDGNLQALGEGLKELSSMKYLLLDLERNELMKNPEQIENLGKSIKELENLY